MSPETGHVWRARPPGGIYCELCGEIAAYPNDPTPTCPMREWIMSGSEIEQVVSKFPCKKSIYMDNDTWAAIEAQAARLDRPVSWVLRRCWDLAEKQITDAPAPPWAPKAAT